MNAYATEDRSEMSRIAGILAGQMQQNRLTTVIIGNGLTLESGGPSTEDLKQRVADGVESYVYEDLAGAAPPPEPDFARLFRRYSLEELCYAAINSKVLTWPEMQKRLREALRRQDGNELRPSLSHEVIAHLADKDLIKVVVDFNFDDVLVDILRDELGVGRVNVAYNDSDFSAYFREIDHREEDQPLFSEPLVIKPHGWVRDPHNIRVTKNTVLHYGPFLHQLLMRIYQESDVTILIGYSARDPDFQKHLSDLEPHRVFKKVVWVEKQRDPPRSIDKAISLMGDDSTLLLDTDATAFLECLGERCAQIHRVPGITRHRIRCAVAEAVDDDHLLETRFLLELLMLAAKARGYFGEEALVTCNRLAAYLARFKRKKMDRPAELMQMLQERRILKCRPYRFEHHYACDPTKLGRHTVDLLSDWASRTLNQQELDAWFGLLVDDFDIDVSGDIGSVLPFRFRHAVPILTMRDLEKRAEKVFAADEIKVSSERGEWLIREKWRPMLAPKGENVHVLLVGDPGPRGTYYRRRQEEEVLNALHDLEFEVRSLRNASHALHITMNNRQAIVFRRRWREPTISPYWIDRPNDHQLVQQEFQEMWKRSKLP